MPSATTTRLRRRLARGAERILGRLRLVEPRRQAPLHRPQADTPRAARPARPVEPAPSAEPVPFAASGPPRPTSPPPTAPEPAAAPAVPTAPPSGGDLELAAVQELFDDMIRPALQSDGGDIELLRVEGGDVFVRLVGACSSCPSSILTMKMGIERLLEEELPGFQRLIQVGGLQAPDLSAFEG